MGERSSERPGSAAERETLAPPSSAETDAVHVWLAYKPGERIAERYLLLRKLDQGGMGVVWVAHHLGLDIHVALKLVRPEDGSVEAAERLVLEAQAAARLDHPAIVQVLDVGRTAEGDPFLVMELLDGESLADVLERRWTLDVVTAIQVILPIADALGAMHAKGIIHRDVKPENIFLARSDTGRWQPKLIDFGVASLGSPSSSPLTGRGEIVGTPRYLPPERIWGEDSDPRDDVWALCVMLYEMVAGARPFEGKDAAQLILALTLNEPEPLSFHGVDAPELWEILQRGFNQRRARWPSARALGKALAGELWRLGVTQDVSGVSLQANWIDGDGPPRSPRVATARAPEPPAPPAPPAVELVTTTKHRPPAAEIVTTKVQRPPTAEIVTTKIQRPQLALAVTRSAATADDVPVESPPPSEVVEQHISSAPPPPPVDSSRTLARAAAIGVLFLLLAGFLASKVSGRPSGPPLATAGAAVPPTTLPAAATAQTAPGVEAPPPRAMTTSASPTTERRPPRTRQSPPTSGASALPAVAPAPVSASAPAAATPLPASASVPAAGPPPAASATATPVAPDLKDPFQPR
jgi:serine/threonine protein kinase